MKDKIFYVTIILFLLVTRLFALDILPPFLTHDEVVYGVVAESFAVQGKTLTQDQNWYSLKPVHPFYAELPAVIMTPFFWITNNPLLAVRLPTAVMGVIFPFIFGWFMYGIWQNKKLQKIAIVIASINPLWWQFSRLSYDAVYSTFFYFLGGAIFFSRHKYAFLASIPVFAVGFFQYQGFKLLLVPWVALITLVWVINQRESKSWFQDFISHLIHLKLKKSFKFFFQIRFLPLACCMLLLLVYTTLMLPHENVEGRLHGTLLQDQSILSEIVDDQRRKAIQTPIAPLFANKFTALIQLSTDRLFNSFSPHMLFLNSEPSASGFAVWSHGLFYLIDIPLLILGIGALQMKKNKSIGVPILMLIPLFAAPVIINITSEWYLLRSFFAYTLMLIIISWGAQVWWKSRYKWFLLLLTALSVLNFGSQYLIRYPVMGADAGFFSERIVTEYINWAKKEFPNEPITVYTIDPPILLSSYILHSQSLSKNMSNQIAYAFENKSYSFDGIIFVDVCVDINSHQLGITEAIRDRCRDKSGFSAEENKITIPALKDSGSVYEILNDRICSKYNLGTFIQVSSLDKFKLDTLSEEAFCQQWITDLKKV